MRDGHDNRLPGALGRATDELRHEPSLRAEWRAELLRRVSDESRTQSVLAATSKRLSISIPWAIAAGLACALVGGAVARLAPSVARSAASPQEQRERSVAAAAPVVPSSSTGSAAVVLPVKFSVVAPNAARVSIVGDFNDWNPTALPMKRSADGRLWEVEVRLPLGRYSYAFMIDGHLATDPAAPSSAGDEFGTPNSVLMVRGS